jgi:hypothetical protein
MVEVLEENKKFRLASVYNQGMAEGGKDNSLQHTHIFKGGEEEKKNGEEARR